MALILVQPRDPIIGFSFFFALFFSKRGVARVVRYVVDVPFEAFVITVGTGHSHDVVISWIGRGDADCDELVGVLRPLDDRFRRRVCSEIDDVVAAASQQVSKERCGERVVVVGHRGENDGAAISAPTRGNDF